jgi:hypothetical protein
MIFPIFLWFLLMFTSIFGYGPGFGTLELRIRQKLRILADPDPRHWSFAGRDHVVSGAGSVAAAIRPASRLIRIPLQGGWAGYIQWARKV